MLTIEFTGTTRTRVLQEAARGTVHDLPGGVSVPSFVRVRNKANRTVSGTYDLRITVGRPTDETQFAPKSGRRTHTRSGLAISQIGKWVGGEAGWETADATRSLEYVYPVSWFTLSATSAQPTLSLPPRESLLLPLGFRVVWQPETPWVRATLQFPVRAQLLFNAGAAADASTFAIVAAPSQAS